MRVRLAIGVATVMLVGLLCWPATWKQGRDSFPLSPYPMFARKKSSPMMSLEYAIAIDSQGDRHFVAPTLVGSEEVMQARALIHRALAGGPYSAKLFCDKLLVTLRASSSHRDTVQVQLVRGKHNAVAYLQSDKSESVETVVVSCKP